MMEIPVSGDLTEKVTIPWQVLLNYEFACRKLAFRLVREEAKTLNEALLECIKDAECKEVNFTSPIAIGGTAKRKAPAQPNWDEGVMQQAGKGAKNPPWKKAKGKGKGKTKGGRMQGKGSKPTSKKKWLSYTPDGRQICYNFNKPKGCHDASCERVHICQVPSCGGNHAASSCPKRGTDAAGAEAEE